MLKTNVPIVYELLLNKIYFPVILETDTDMPVVGKRTLHMVRFNINKSCRLGNNTEKEIIEFYYSNIKRLFSFLNTIKPDEVPQIYKDVFINNVDIFASLPFDVKILADETIKIVCNRSDAEMYFKKVKRKFIRRIRKLKKPS